MSIPFPARIVLEFTSGLLVDNILKTSSSLVAAEASFSVMLINFGHGTGFTEAGPIAGARCPNIYINPFNYDYIISSKVRGHRAAATFTIAPTSKKQDRRGGYISG